MSLLLAALIVVGITSSAMLAGGQVYTWVAILPHKEALTAERSLALHREMMQRPDAYLFPAGVVVMVSAVALSVVCLMAGQPVALAMSLLAVAGMAVTAFVSQRSNRPINRLVMDPAVTPAAYEPMALRWHRIHRIRTVSSCVALLGFELAAGTLIAGY